MTIEQGRLDFSSAERAAEIPVRYVLDGVFLTPGRRVLVREVPLTAQFSPGKVDLPSMQVDRVGSARSMRHAVLSLIRAETGVRKPYIDDAPFMADRTIAKNNGGYRDTRRIYYKGLLADETDLPPNYYLIDTEDMAEIARYNLWRRPTITRAIDTALSPMLQAREPQPLVPEAHIESAVDPRIARHSHQSRWNLKGQMELAAQAETAELDVFLLNGS